MTRQDQIKEMAKFHARCMTCDKDLQVAFADALRRGAEWADKHPQKSGKPKRPRWVSADTQPKATGYYVTEDKRGALAVCLWDSHGWHYAWAPVVRWLDMRLEKEK